MGFGTGPILQSYAPLLVWKSCQRKSSYSFYLILDMHMCKLIGTFGKSYARFWVWKKSLSYQLRLLYLSHSFQNWQNVLLWFEDVFGILYYSFYCRVIPLLESKTACQRNSFYSFQTIIFLILAWCFAMIWRCVYCAGFLDWPVFGRAIPCFESEKACQRNCPSFQVESKIVCPSLKCLQIIVHKL